MSVGQRKFQEDQYYRTYQDILRSIMEDEHSTVFFRPVDPVNDNAPGYLSRIPRPMAILTVQEKLDKREYKTTDDFIRDMNQIWTNAKIYNPQRHAIYERADSLAQRFEKLSATLPHSIPEGSRGSSVQRFTELRLARYRANKNRHR